MKKRSLFLGMFLIHIVLLAFICLVAFLVIENYTKVVNTQERHTVVITTDSVAQILSDCFSDVQKIGYKANSQASRHEGIWSILDTINNDSETTYERDNIKSILSFLSTACSSNQFIADGILVTGNGDSFVYSNKANHNVYASYKYLENEPFASFFQGNEYDAFYYGGIPEYTSIGDTHLLSYVCKIYNMSKPTNHKVLGILIINFDVDGIREYIARTFPDYQGSITAFYENDDMLFSTDETTYLEYKDELFHGANTDRAIYENVNRETGLHVLSVLSEDALSAKAEEMKERQLLIFASGLLVSLLVYSFMFSRINHRVGKLVNAISNTGFSKPIEVDTSRELGIIATAFNEKNEQLNQWIDRTYSAQLQLRTAELQALTSQVNPHFLYNTLESLRMKALISGNEDIAESLSFLGNIYRWMLNTGENVVAISREMDYVASYMELQSLRFPDRINYEIILPQNYKYMAVPKLILQPLVENAILHTNLSEPINITIEVKGYDDDVIITVKDTGEGIPEEELRELISTLDEHISTDEGHGIGCRNVHQRLRLLFGKKYGLVIHSTQGIGTISEISFPRMTVQEMNNNSDNQSGGNNASDLNC